MRPGRDNPSTTQLTKRWAEKLGLPSGEEQLYALRHGKTKEEDRLGIESIEHIDSAAFDRDEVIALAEIDLNFLAALAMPTTFVHMFPATHLTAWAILTSGERDTEQQFLQIALGIPRSHAKTTLIKLFVLWCVLYSKRKFILVTGSIIDRAIDILSDIADMLNEDNIRAVFGDWNISKDTDMKQLKKFSYRGRSIILAAMGSEGSVRGMNLKNQRPDVMIFDDIQTKECADSPVQSKSLEEWMVGTAMKAKSPSGCMFIFAGNMFATPHSILRKLKTNPSWIKFISGAILLDGTALWPELRSLKSLIDELNNDIAMGQAHIFFSEVMNDTDAGTNSQVDYSKFPDWPWHETDLPQGKFLIIDPSQGKQMDADVILRCEVYDGKVGVRDVIEEQLSPSNLVRKALIEAITNNIFCIAVESMGYQFTLLHWFQVICDEYHIKGINFVPLYMNNHSKNSRIAAGIKSMQTREVILHPSIKSRVHRQIADWNPMKRDNVDDILDAIGNCTKVVAEYSFEIMSRTNVSIIDSTGAKVRENNSCF